MAHQHPHPHPSGPPQQMMPPPAHLPSQQADLLDSIPFNSVSFILKEGIPRQGAPPPLPVVLSAENEQLVDEKNGIDFRDLNQLNFWMSWLNESHAPPPPNVVLQANHAAMVTKAKEEGNVRPISAAHSFMLLPAKLTLSPYSPRIDPLQSQTLP